jgi:TonB-dependent Receptor Plug Domain
MNKIRLFVVTLSLLLTQFSLASRVQSQTPSVYDSLKVMEKVYLHVDRDSYFAGEDIWFKAYLIDALDRLLTDHSNSLHVELISPSLKIVSNRIIRLDGGLGNGDFKLQEDLRSGRYKIRAYTNYMRNFSDESFFTKEIIVINAHDDQTRIQEEKKVVEKNISLSFFPEGGSLVSNVSSRISFKAVDNNGKGTDVSGKIYSSSGDIITKFKSAYLGMGSFFLRPLPGFKYYSISRGADSIDIRTELPTVFPTGVTISLKKNQDDELVLIINTNRETLAKLTENELKLSTSIRKEIINIIHFKLKSSDTSFVVPTNYYPDGILCLTLSTLENLPLAERLVYIEKEAPLKIEMVTDKLLYKKREAVKLKISLTCDSIIEHDGNASLSVVNESFINNTSQFPRSISSWFLLESDVHGVIEDPSYYFDLSNPSRLSDLDLLLRTQGWRDFAWKYDTIYFPPEKGFTISGRLTKLSKNKPIDGSRVSIGIFGTNKNILTTIPVDSIGRFKLSGVDLIGEARIVASGIDQKDRMKGTLFIDSVTYNPAKVRDSLSVVSTLVNFNQSKLRSYYIINEAIRKKYKLSDTISIGEVHIVSERHKDPQTIKIESSRLKYGTPDAELIITDHMEGYTNLPELMKGKFPGVEVVGPRDGNYNIYFRGLSTINGDPNPLLLIDGNPISFDELSWIPISLIERIDVLKLTASTTIYGLRGGCGVINLITKAGGETGKYRLPEYSAKLKISGYNASRLFYSPQHMIDSNSDLNPDLRYTLLWNPEINLESNKEIILNYFNGDNASKIRIIAEGITKDGIPMTGNAEYEVR